MLGDREALRRLSEERVTPQAEFAVSSEVWDGVRSWVTVLRSTRDSTHTVRYCCGECGQGIAVAWNVRGKYTYTPAELDGLKLAHLIQAHDWTRETIGEH